ncbi:UDP-N-acetylglucosamine 2-epimerase [Metabacillus sp. cB07]|uniref:UDP-N-acetylglucosamine 2-epimerase n=1 Tax=Metabacillus sp. cB07 TaxID=2806989 RepID=UPI00193A6D4A|nr:UDP-N-acetylglucosamine 2-epimerase [Metabacillus sp. cB07]
MNKKHIVCLTGTRADYGIYRNLLLSLDKSEDFSLSLIVTGMHVIQEYGNTIEAIKQDNLQIAASPAILLKGDSELAMSQSLGLGILYFSTILDEIRPDYLLVLGDRGEMLAGAISAHYLNIPIVHFHGGEFSGSADDSIRHAISKLAHLHFVSSDKSRTNLLNLGEEKWRIQVIGSLRKTEINEVKNMNKSQMQELKKKYSIDSKSKLFLVVFHPDSRDSVPVAIQIDTLISSLDSFKHQQMIFIGANSDAGGELFNQKFRQFCSQHAEQSAFFSSVPQKDYLFLLSQADVLIGNSSSGLIEAPFFHLPFVLLGNRQNGREKGSNVIEIPYDEKAVVNAVSSLLHSKKIESSNPYDVTNCPESHVLAVLNKSIDQWRLLNKKAGE